MIAWMLYCVVVTTIVAAAARAAESVARINGYRLRWVWLGALALTTYLSISSAIQRVERREMASAVASTEQMVATVAAPSGWMESLRALGERVERAMDGALVVAARAITDGVPPAARRLAALAWVTMSLLLFAAFAAVVFRFRRARRNWPRSSVQEIPVRVSPNVGPFVMGMVRPEIVVPRWLLHRADDEQRLAVVHEHEHLRARDPILLGVAWFAVILAPWNAALWYMVTRLRLAIELDCDARVLRRGVTPRAYGSLLIEVAQNASPLTLSALGFADHSSQLYERILALRGPTASFARTRAALAFAAAVTGVLIACRAAPPAAVADDVPADRAAAPAPIATTPTSPALEMPRRTIAPRSSVVKLRARPVRVAISSPVTEDKSSTGSVEPPVAVVSVREDSATSRVATLEPVARKSPLVLIDGVRSSMDEMDGMDPKTIASIEVLKGPAALATYGDGAERGVISVTTIKPASPPR